MTQQAEDTVEDFLARVRRAWDAGDAAAYARQFTEEATYVIFRGEALQGRAQIESAHVDVLMRGTKVIIEPIAVTMLDDDVASVLTISGIGTDEVREYDKFQTIVLVRQDGRWRCAAFQNTEMSDRARRLHRAPAEAAAE
jgi:uncharacterized protein (TIGR02246 family)